MRAVNRLDRFETLAEQLVEGTFERLFRTRLHPSDVARRLARALEDGQLHRRQRANPPPQPILDFP